MKFRKFISVLATLAIVLSMVTMPVKAADTHWVLDNSSVTLPSGITRVTSNVGGGKGASDDALCFSDGAKYIWNGGNGEQFAFTKPVDNMTTYTGYMIMQMNIMSPVTTKSFAIKSNSNVAVAGREYPSGTQPIVMPVTSTYGFAQNRWNHVVIVWRLNNGAYNTENMTVYVNGTQQAQQVHRLYSSGYTQFRIYAEGEGNIYFDDVTIDFTDSAPNISTLTAMPTLSGVAGAAVAGSDINLTDPVTLSTLAGANTTKTVTAYANDTFATPLASGDTLADGNIVIVTDTVGKMSYYNVVDASIHDTHWALNNSAVTLPSGITVETNVGGGKAASDDVLCFSDGAKYIWNGGSGEQFAFTKPVDNMTTYTGYMVMQMNIMSPVTTKSFAIKSNSNVTVAGREFDGAQPVVMGVNPTYGFAQNRWNHVVIVWRLNNGAYNTENMTLYVNGTQQAQQVHRLYSSSYTQLRIYAEGDGNLYFDDVTIDFTTSAPDISTLAAMPTLSASAYSITNAAAKSAVGATRIYSGADMKSSSLLTNDADTVGYGYYLVKEVVDADDVRYAYSRASGGSGVDLAILDRTYAANKTVSFTRANSSYVYGLGGKDANDESMKITTSTGNTQRYFQYNFDKTIKDNYTYLVIDCNVYIEDGGDFKNFGFGTGGSVTITGQYTSSTLKLGAWNNFLSIITFDGTNAPDYRTYVNGTFAGDGTCSSNRLLTDEPSVIRGVFNTYNASGACVAYIDDLRIYGTNALPSNAMPTLTGIAGATVSEKYLRLSSSVTLSTLIAANTDTVTAYTDDTFAVALSSDNTLEDGNVIIITNALGKMSYYAVTQTVVTDSLWSLDNSDIETTSAITVETNVGGGKAASDDVLHFLCNGNEVYRRLNGINIAESGALTAPIKDMTQYTGYMIIEMNVMSPVDTVSVGITTNSGNIVVGTSAGGRITMNSKYRFAVNRWNHVVSVIRFVNGSTEEVQTTYVNGKQISQRAHPLYSAGKTDIRLTAYGTGDVYFDDVKIKFTQTEPDVEALSAMPTVKSVGERGYAGDRKFYIAGDVLTTEILSNNGAVTIFSDKNFTTKITTAQILASGNLIMVSNNDGTLSYYDVRSVLVDDTGYIKDENGTSISGYKEGTMTFEKRCFVGDQKPVLLAIAKYSNIDNHLINCEFKTVMAEDEAKFSLSSDIEDVDDTTIKFFVWEKDTNKPLSQTSEFSPFNPSYTYINATDTSGDYCFFDNRYCYVSSTPYYPNFTAAPKTNTITCTRLQNYQSPTRTDYIYMNRTTSDDCFFDIDVKLVKSAHYGDKLYKYFKFEGDFTVNKLGSIIQLPMIRDTKTSASSVTSYPCQISSTGIFNYGDSTTSGSKKVTAGSTFHYLMFINLNNSTCDIYASGSFGTITKKGIPINSGIKQLNTVRVCLTSGSAGTLTIDNFNLTGLEQPIVNGVETKTNVFSKDTEVKAFLSGKTAVHGYGNTLYKNGTKSALAKGIYDKDYEEYYVPASSLASIFGITESFSAGKISGTYNISSSGTITTSGGADKGKLAIRVEDDVIYVPLRQFAREIMQKNVWFFKTGIFIISDTPLELDTSDWKYQSERVVEQTTVWNDIDYLNNFLQYLRPDAAKLKADYKAKTGDSTFTSHPRVLLDATKFAEMRAHYESRDDETYNAIADRVISLAESYLDEDPISYSWDDSMRTLGATAGNLLKRFIYMGYAYQLTGDKRYVDKAVEQFEVCATYPDFNTAHIIDTGDDCFALAIGFDWFYNGFTSSQRTMAKGVVHDRALKALASGLYGRLSSGSSGATRWLAFKWMSNYNAIINGGVIAAAVATLEYDTDETFQYLADSLRSMEYSLQMLTPDGGWNEAVTYWAYAMRYITTAGAVLDNCFGTTYGIMDGQGMDNTLNYAISCLGTKGINNYGDSDKGSASTAYSFNVFYGLAKMFNNPIAAKMRDYDIANGTNADYYDAMFYDFDMAATEADADSALPKLLKTGGTEIVSIRDTYDKAQSKSYFSAHFGTTSGYHQHCDCGTFVLDLLGQRWAEDLGRDDYNLQNEFGYSGYQIYRNRAEAHNVLVLNSAAYSDSYEMKSGEFAKIIDAQSNSTSGFVYANLDNVYNEASKMKLGYFMGDNMRSLIMRNEFTLNAATDATWSIITKASVEISGNTAYLTRGGKTVKLTFICSGNNAHWESLEAAPGANSPSCPEQTANTGYTKLALKFDATAGDNYFAVKISEKSASSITNAPISSWTLE